MKTTSRWGWMPPARPAFLRIAGVALAVLLSAQVVLPQARAADVPLKPVKPAPVYSTDPGPYDVAWAGRGMRQGGGSATLTLTLAGPPYGAWLYLSGRDDPAGPAPHFPDGDAAVRVEITNGNGTKSVVTAVPVAYRTETDFVNRVNVGRYLSRGKNTLAVSGYDLNVPDGAVAYAVGRGRPGTPSRLVQVVDGLDLGHYAAEPPYGPDTELASFAFAPSALPRDGRVVLAVAGAEAGRGDELFAATGTGGIAAGLHDTDRDGLPDIVNRRVPLTQKDAPPAGSVDPADDSGELEARRSANSLEEDGLGVPRGKGGFGVGAGLSVVDLAYNLQAGRSNTSFQVQSEDPEDGDAVKLIVALHVIEMEGINPVPEVEVLNDAEPAELPEGGGTASFRITVNNIGGEEVRLTSLVDDVFGNLDGAGNCALPASIPLGGVYSCSFSEDLTGVHDVPHRDVVTAGAVGAVSGLPVSDSDEALVVFAPHRGSRIGGRAWADVDWDRAQGPEETGIDGVSVLLRDAAGSIVATTTTARVDGFPGSYVFGGLEAGPYVVEMIPPANWSQTYDPDGTATANRTVRHVGVDEGAMDVAFGYAPNPGRIVVIKLTDVPTDQSFAFTTSWGAEFALGSGGRYESVPLAVGTYAVVEGITQGWNQMCGTCDDGSLPGAISLQPGETVTCTFMDVRVQPGMARK